MRLLCGISISKILLIFIVDVYPVAPEGKCSCLQDLGAAFNLFSFYYKGMGKLLKI